MKPLTTVATIASAVICVLLIAAFVASYHLEDRRHAIHITSSVTFGIADGRLSFGRNEGSYILDNLHGARLSYEGGEAIGKRDWKYGIPGCGAQKRTYIGQQGELVAKDVGVIVPGLYWRWFQREKQPLLWTFMFSFWYPIIVSSALPLFSLIQRRHPGSPNERSAGDGGTASQAALVHAQPAAPDHDRWEK